MNKLLPLFVIFSITACTPSYMVQKNTSFYGDTACKMEKESDTVLSIHCSQPTYGTDMNALNLKESTLKKAALSTKNSSFSHFQIIEEDMEYLDKSNPPRHDYHMKIKLLEKSNAW